MNPNIIDRLFILLVTYYHISAFEQIFRLKYNERVEIFIKMTIVSVYVIDFSSFYK